MNNLLFSFQKVCKEYGIGYDECLVLLYLYELGLFGLRINIFKKRINLGDYLLKDFIKEDYSHYDKKLYKLSSLGSEIVKCLLQYSSDTTNYVGENRSVGLGLKNKVTSALSNYFRKE